MESQKPSNFCPRQTEPRSSKSQNPVLVARSGTTAPPPPASTGILFPPLTYGHSALKGTQPWGASVSCAGSRLDAFPPKQGGK
jgi:hypothetical protein